MPRPKCTGKSARLAVYHQRLALLTMPNARMTDEEYFNRLIDDDNARFADDVATTADADNPRFEDDAATPADAATTADAGSEPAAKSATKADGGPCYVTASNNMLLQRVLDMHKELERMSKQGDEPEGLVADAGDEPVECVSDGGEEPEECMQDEGEEPADHVETRSWKTAGWEPASSSSTTWKATSTTEPWATAGGLKISRKGCKPNGSRTRGTKTRGCQKEQHRRKLERGSEVCAERIAALFASRASATDEAYLKRVFGAAAFHTMCEAAARERSTTQQ
jgi:hypothetical protein